MFRNQIFKMFKTKKTQKKQQTQFQLYERIPQTSIIASMDQFYKLFILITERFRSLWVSLWARYFRFLKNYKFKAVDNEWDLERERNVCVCVFVEFVDLLWSEVMKRPLLLHRWIAGTTNTNSTLAQYIFFLIFLGSSPGFHKFFFMFLNLP